MSKTTTAPPKATLDKVAEWVDATPARPAAIAKAAGVSVTTARRALTALAEQGTVTQSDNGQWTNVPTPVEPPKTKSNGNNLVIDTNTLAVTIETNDANDVVVTAETYDTLAARTEWRELKAWQDGGRKGERPTTSNLDAMNAAHAAGRPKPKKAKANGGGGRRSTRSPRGQEALDEQRKLKNKRGKGRKVTDEELTDHIRQVRKAHPESSCYDEEEYAYWVDKMALGIERWNRVWASLDEEFVSTTPATSAA